MSPSHRADTGSHLVTNPNHPNSLLNHRYDLGTALGHGGMAEVRIGTDHRLGRTVAIKTLRADLAADPVFQTRFRREAQSAAALNHPSIVAVYDTGEDVLDGVSVPYIVMEYVEGRTLRDVLREGHRIVPERAMEITADVLDALEYSHRSGIIHRDIKPANVMLTPNGDVKVMDFGIARAISDTSATLTQTAAVVGTAQYLSPEQARGAPVDARSDIYSAGCLLYELLTGRPPFVGDSPVSVAYQHVSEEPQPPSTHAPELPAAAEAVTLRSMRKNPLDRYQSAAEMRADLHHALTGQHVAPPAMPPTATIHVPPPPHPPDVQAPPERTSHRARGRYAQRRTVYAVVALASLLVLAAAVIGIRALTAAPKTTTAPTVTDRTVPQARTILRHAGLAVGATKPRSSDTVPKGTIISQSPGAGGSVPIGSRVNVTVSAGKALVVVPNVVDQHVDEARALLEAQGFKVDETQDSSSDENAGTVTRADPGEGTKVPSGSTVHLLVSSGLVEMPKVLQQGEQEAEARLKDAGFKVRKVQRTTSTEPPGTVLDQTPAAGDKRQRGSTVTIVVARAPEPEPTTTEPEPDSPDLPDL